MSHQPYNANHQTSGITKLYVYSRLCYTNLASSLLLGGQAMKQINTVFSRLISVQNNINDRQVDVVVRNYGSQSSSNQLYIFYNQVTGLTIMKAGSNDAKHIFRYWQRAHTTVMNSIRSAQQTYRQGI
jgi:hypothetical protein